MTLHIVWMFSVSLLTLGVGATHGQDYPNKVVRIVAGSVGGGNDFVARLLAQGLTAPLGQPVIVENRGSGFLPGEKPFPKPLPMAIPCSSTAAPTGLDRCCEKPRTMHSAIFHL